MIIILIFEMGKEEQGKDRPNLYVISSSGQATSVRIVYEESGVDELVWRVLCILMRSFYIYVFVFWLFFFHIYEFLFIFIGPGFFFAN